MATDSDYIRPLAAEKILRDIQLPVYRTISLDFAVAMVKSAKSAKSVKSAKSAKSAKSMGQIAKSSVRRVAQLIWRLIPTAIDPWLRKK